MSQYNTRYRDKDVQKFYASKEWRQKRLDFLIDNPFCIECKKKGRLTKAVVVDHIRPIRMGGERLSDDNLQALCQSCHSAKSIKEGSRYGVRKAN